MIVCGNFKHLEPIIPSLDIESKEVSGKRYYNTPDGNFPSVTTVTGWSKRKFFAEWRKNNPEESARVCSRGTKLHSLVETYLLNVKIDLNGSGFDDNLKDLFLTIKPEVDKINNIRCIETPLWSKTLGLAGRVDCIAEHDRELSIIDFKGSTRPKRKEDIDNYFLQATAYSLMWQEMTGEKIKKLKILIASEDGILQIFEEPVINYVSNLKDAIDLYERETK
jgi:genome maintenance exonuclease 1